jgi:hypothetical protein
MTEYHGHMTLSDGTHVPLSKEEAEKLWLESERIAKERAEKLPTEKDAIDALFEAQVRLKELGWREAMYCPKDGTTFRVIEAGSTGIFECYYEGKWADGYYMTSDGGDIYPSRSGPLLFKPMEPK